MYSMVCILKMDSHNPMIPNTEGKEVMYVESAKPYLQSEPKSGPLKLTKNGEKFQIAQIASFVL